MMKKVADIAAYLFILSVIILSVVSILGVWEFFQDDVISKSFQSIGLLAVVAVIVMTADHFLDRQVVAPDAGLAPAVAVGGSKAAFRGLRVVTVSILILAVALLALFGILAIWEVVAGKVLHQSLSSIAIAAFSSLVIVVTCLEREGNNMLRRRQASGGMIFFTIILVWILASLIFGLF